VNLTNGSTSYGTRRLRPVFWLELNGWPKETPVTLSLQEKASPKCVLITAPDTGKEIIILLCGGDKTTQQANIDRAKKIAKMPLEEE
jgi:hypothetical protein